MLLPQVVWNAIPVHGWLLSVFHNVVGPKLAGLQKKRKSLYVCDSIDGFTTHAGDSIQKCPST